MNIQESFKNELLQLSKNHSIILLYPLPEVGWKPNRKIFIERHNKFFKIQILQTLLHLIKFTKIDLKQVLNYLIL